MDLIVSKINKLDRRTFIGGSDTAIIMRLSSYKTPYELYLEKTAEIEAETIETPYQYWGNQLESVIRNEFEKRNNVVVTQLETQTHPIHSFMKANLDGFIPEKNAVLEIKCSSSFMVKSWGEPDTSEIPPAYLIQVAHYCAVTNADSAHIAVLIGGNEYREYIYTRDYQLEERIISEVCDFWKRIQDRNPPPASNISDVQLMYSQSFENATESNFDIDVELSRIQSVRASIKVLEAQEAECKMKIMQHMKESDTLISQDKEILATWKATKTGSRRFVLKEASINQNNILEL